MLVRVIKSAVALSSLSIMGACATAPDVTRATVWGAIGDKRAITSIAREFVRETPYVVHFAFNKSDLDATARAELDIQARWIMQHPTVRFSVYGHTDKVGSNAYNQELGRARAEAVIAYLISRGVSLAQLELKVSMGEDAPIIDVDTAEQINRRATTYVAGLVKVATAQASESDIPVESDKPEKPEEGPEPEKPEEEPEPEKPEVEPEDEKPEVEPEDEKPEVETEPENDPQDEPEDQDREEEEKEEEKDHVDAGRGNGDEDGDPGKSEEKNQGGDEA